GLGLRVRKPEARMLEQAHGHAQSALVRLSDEVPTGKEMDDLLAHRLAHLLVVPQPVARAAREQVVPRRLGRKADAARRGLRRTAGSGAPSHVTPARAAW